MASAVKLPELGENIGVAVVGRVLVSPGDRVEVDQPVVEIETDKATAEVPSTAAGVIAEVRVEQGDEIRVGQVLIVVEAAARTADEPPASTMPRAEAAPAPASGAAAPRGEPAPPPRVAEAPASPVGPVETAAPSSRVAPSSSPAATPASTAARVPDAAAAPGPLVPASPAVRRLAREIGADVGEIRGTGPGGRLSIDDVKAHARQRVNAVAEPALPDFSAWGPVRREPMSTIRRRTAENIARAWRTVPHVTQFDEADVSRTEELRRRWAPQAEARGTKLTITAFAVRAAAAALRAFPRVNASVDVAHGEMVLKDYVHVGVAVDTERGLLVPVVRDADRKGILDIAVELADLSTRGRAGKLALDEMRGATFSVSNLGALGTTHFSPIVNWPEVAILGVGRAIPRVVLEAAGPVERPILPLSVSYDHRAIDGAEAARFLRRIAEALEEPARMMLD